MLRKERKGGSNHQHHILIEPLWDLSHHGPFLWLYSFLFPTIFLLNSTCCFHPLIAETMEKKQANSVFWSPTGQFVILAGLRKWVKTKQTCLKPRIWCHFCYICRRHCIKEKYITTRKVGLYFHLDYRINCFLWAALMENYSWKHLFVLKNTICHLLHVQGNVLCADLHISRNVGTGILPQQLANKRNLLSKLDWLQSYFWVILCIFGRRFCLNTNENCFNPLGHIIKRI